MATDHRRTAGRMLDELVGRLIPRGLLRGVAILAGGTALAQAITVLASPIVTRIYEPADFGRLGLLVAFMNVASVAICLRFEVAIVSGRSDDEAAQLAILAMWILPLSTILATAVFAVLVLAPLGAYGQLPLGWIPLVMVALPAVGLAGVLRYWIVRRQEYQPLARLTLVQSTARTAAQLGLGALQWGSSGLAVGDALGRVAGVVTLGVREIPRILQSKPTFRPAVKGLFREYWRFPTFALPSSLVNTLAGAMPVPLIGALYGLQPAGQYVLVQTVIALPVGLVVGSVADVFHGRIAELARSAPQDARLLFRRAIRLLAGVGLIIALALAIGAPPLFPLVFGSEWSTSGVLAAVLGPRVMMHVTVSPLSRVVYVYDGQRAKLIFDVTVLATTIGAVAGAAYLSLPFLAAVALLVVGDLIAYGLYGYILWRLTEKPVDPRDQP